MGIIKILGGPGAKTPVADAIRAKIQRARERIGGVVIGIEDAEGAPGRRLAGDAAAGGGGVEDVGCERGVVRVWTGAVADGGELDGVAGADVVALVNDVVGVAGGVAGHGRLGALLARGDLRDGGGDG